MRTRHEPYLLDEPYKYAVSSGHVLFGDPATPGHGAWVEPFSMSNIQPTRRTPIVINTDTVAGCKHRSKQPHFTTPIPPTLVGSSSSKEFCEGTISEQYQNTLFTLTWPAVAARAFQPTNSENFQRSHIARTAKPVQKRTSVVLTFVLHLYLLSMCSSPLPGLLTTCFLPT
ncbi:hypothetical protein FA15DRAFT_300623 [Coprinopsis marcescibilis]|uniref:Uncharacterized protein n=1 Tax=Coprinopsis marcescibilis TaxID=230819 RepID=A0A5C3L0M9_COPMA|nr:hypothetical protein FA15DRAFT_300623 [Coprinopsis marcescibilis]